MTITDHAARDGEGQLRRADPDASRPALISFILSGRSGVPGTGGSMRWFFTSVWLVYLVQPVAALFGHHHGALWIAGGVTITVAFAVIYVPSLLYVERWPRLTRAGLIAIVVLAALACTVYGKDWTPLWIYVSAATGMILTARGRPRVALLGVVAVAALYCFFSWRSHLDLGDYLAILLPVLLTGLTMIGFRMQMVLMRELAQARGAVARLAANEERVRLARDMHDLTGQSLSTITLKSELAAKRLAKLSPSAERDAALAELGDIGQVSRQTLHDIREAVSGYRRPTLAIEVITARHALEAAGISLDDDTALTLRSGTFDPEREAALAWCLREAVTNVIRHSGATSCRIRLAERDGELSLEVTDDGRGLAAEHRAAEHRAGGHQDGGHQDGDHAQPSRGSGLRNMSERLSAVSGRLSLSPAEPAAGRRGFRLTATVSQAPVAADNYQL
jgi:two-component system sensor histidine kinase DesK